MVKLPLWVAATIIVLVVGLLAMPLTVLADGGQSITRNFLLSAADSWLYEGNSNTNYGGDDTMEVQSDSGKNGRTIVQFDLSQIPTGSTVSSATLSLYASAVPAVIRTYDAHRITTSWAEGTVRWKAGWPWTTAGGDFNVATSSTTTPGTAGWMDFDVTSDVASFLTGTANYGWLIKDETEDSATTYTTTFYTKEEATETTLRPKLAVTFTASWDSYRDELRNFGEETFTSAYTTVYMEGTGFLDGSQTYNIGYYDADGTLVTTDNGIGLALVVGDRGTLGNPDSPYEPTYTFIADPDATPGVWHAVVQLSGASSFPPDYITLSADPDAYDLIGDDTFIVGADAIPEFPVVISAIGVALLCFGIYWWMRRRMLVNVKA